MSSRRQLPRGEFSEAGAPDAAVDEADLILDQPDAQQRRLVAMPGGPAARDGSQQRWVSRDLRYAGLDLGPTDSCRFNPQRQVDAAPIGQQALNASDHNGRVLGRGKRVLGQRTYGPNVVTHPERTVEQQPDAEQACGDSPRVRCPAHAAYALPHRAITTQSGPLVRRFGTARD